MTTMVPGWFAAVLGERPRARILLEASTESEWVARCLERLGHEVVVADGNFAPMYATRTRTIKTDRRDARALAETCRLGAYRAAHWLSDAQHHVRGRLTVRDALVRTRTGYIAVITCLQDVGASDSGGKLCIYPRRVWETLGSLRRDPVTGAVPLRLAPGDTTVLLGGVVPHCTLPVKGGQNRVVSLLCYRAELTPES